MGVNGDLSAHVVLPEGKVKVALNYTGSVPLLGRILPLPLRPKRVLCMCSPLGGLGGGIEVSRFKKRAVSAKVQTLNSTLWITRGNAFDTVSSFHSSGSKNDNLSLLKWVKTGRNRNGYKRKVAEEL